MSECPYLKIDYPYSWTLLEKEYSCEANGKKLSETMANKCQGYGFHNYRDCPIYKNFQKW